MSLCVRMVSVCVCVCVYLYEVVHTLLLFTSFEIIAKCTDGRR